MDKAVQCVDIQWWSGGGGWPVETVTRIWFGNKIDLLLREHINESLESI